MAYDVATPADARLWKYQPDFSAGFEFRRAFLTDIIRSRNNHEQRRALRDVARLSMKYRTVAVDELQDAKHFLRAAQNAPVAIPDFSRWIASTGASIVTDTTIDVATPPPWIAAGQLLALSKAGTIELVEVDSVADPTVTLTAPLANGWPSGSVVRPALFGLLSGSVQASRLHRGAQAIAVDFAAYPGGEPPEDEGTAAITFNGYEVFVAEPDFAQAPNMGYLWPLESIDFGHGRTAQFRPIDRAEQMVEAQFNGLGVADAQIIEQAFIRAKGSRSAFYRPSCEKDMTLAANTSGLAYFDAVGLDLANDFGSVDYAANPTAIEIVKTDGTRLHKLITGITAVSGKSRVAFSGALTLTTATVARISWMPLSRFASDELATIWRSPLSASISAIFQTVRQ